MRDGAYWHERRARFAATQVLAREGVLVLVEPPAWSERIPPSRDERMGLARLRLWLTAQEPRR